MSLSQCTRQMFACFGLESRQCSGSCENLDMREHPRSVQWAGSWECQLSSRANSRGRHPTPTEAGMRGNCLNPKGPPNGGHSARSRPEPLENQDWLAGAGGFEPPRGGIKIRCLTTWLRPTTGGLPAADRAAVRPAEHSRRLVCDQ